MMGEIMGIILYSIFKGRRKRKKGDGNAEIKIID